MIGERLYLSPINPDDYETYTAWYNDPEIAVYRGFYPRSFTLSAVRERYETATDPHQYAIVLKDSDKLIGNVELHLINHIWRHADLGIMIGEPEYRNNGYGAEAVNLLLKYAFETLNLHNVGLQVLSCNERAIACYKKCGFSEFGRRKEWAFINGEYVDRVYMQILSNHEPVGKHIEKPC
jgi:RimJ/RimL family protein N-acetyltransferase